MDEISLDKIDEYVNNNIGPLCAELLSIRNLERVPHPHTRELKDMLIGSGLPHTIFESVIINGALKMAATSIVSKE